MSESDDKYAALKGKIGALGDVINTQLMFLYALHHADKPRNEIMNALIAANTIIRQEVNNLIHDGEQEGGGDEPK